MVATSQAQWTSAQRLTWTSGWSEWPASAFDSSGNLHAAWTDNTTGHYEVYYKEGMNGGTTWTTARRLTWASSFSSSVAMAIDTADNIHLVWCDLPPGNGEIYYKKSTDGGKTWTASKRLTWTPGSSEDPDITVDSLGNIHVVWEDATPGNYEIYYKKSTDGGLTWMASERLAWTSGPSYLPKIGSHWSGWLYVVWQDDTGGGTEVYFKKGSIGGLGWSAIQRVSWTSGNSASPALAVDFSGNLHLAWIDDTPGNPEVYYSKSTNGGISWSTAKRLTWTSGLSRNPAIAIDLSGNPHVVWEDDVTGKEEVYSRMSPDGGVSWASGQRLTWNSGYSFSPAIAIDSSGSPHVLWWDDTPGNFEIYYKRGN
jgi:hypothetical protein